MREWIKNLLIAIDQLGNTLAGGNPDATVSARTGYFAGTADGSQGLFWRCLQSVIDWAFLPLDGPGHCAQSAARSHDRHHPGNDLLRGVLALLSLPVCGVVGVVLRVVRLVRS